MFAACVAVVCSVVAVLATASPALAGDYYMGKQGKTALLE